MGKSTTTVKDLTQLANAFADVQAAATVEEAVQKATATLPNFADVLAKHLAPVATKASLMVELDALSNKIAGERVDAMALKGKIAMERSAADKAKADYEDLKKALYTAMKEDAYYQDVMSKVVGTGLKISGVKTQLVQALENAFREMVLPYKQAMEEAVAKHEAEIERLGKKVEAIDKRVAKLQKKAVALQAKLES